MKPKYLFLLLYVTVFIIYLFGFTFHQHAIWIRLQMSFLMALFISAVVWIIYKSIKEMSDKEKAGSDE